MYPRNRNRLTRSQRDVQTPQGLQSREYLFDLEYDEIILFQSINYYFENEHRFHNGQKEDLLFDIVNQILDKIANGDILLNIDDYYSGSIENEMDHANFTQMKHLVRDAGSYLYRKMYDPDSEKFKKIREAAKDCKDFEGLVQ